MGTIYFRKCGEKFRGYLQEEKAALVYDTYHNWVYIHKDEIIKGNGRQSLFDLINKNKDKGRVPIYTNELQIVSRLLTLEIQETKDKRVLFGQKEGVNGLFFNYSEIDKRAYRLVVDTFDLEIAAKKMYEFIKNIPFGTCTRSQMAREEIQKRVTDRAHLTELSNREIRLVKNCYRGGFCATTKRTDIMLKNVYSYDIDSCYPYIMSTALYPKGKGESKPASTHKLWLAAFTFTNLKPKSYLSSQLYPIEDKAVYLTSIDIPIFRELYTWDKMEIVDYLGFEEVDLLPQQIRDTIADLYKVKNEKKTNGMDYRNEKLMLNSLSGSMGYMPSKSYPNKNRVFNYECAPFTNAYARLRLYKIIKELGSDFVYCDTDSIKFIGEENKRLMEDGVIGMGAWCFEGISKQFMVLGKKCYMEDDKATIAGLPKGVITDINEFYKGKVIEGEATKLPKLRIDENGDVIEVIYHYYTL